MFWQNELSIRSKGRGTYNITQNIETMIQQSGIKLGLCHVFIHHTSASLILCENADPAVRQDLEAYMASIVQDGDPMFIHRDEGDDDMASHIRSILTQSEFSFPIKDGISRLGTWQGIYLWEHRTSPHQRKITITIHGE